jgi:hypothetical protein
MRRRSLIGAIAGTALVTMSIGVVRAADEGKYPDWKGAWAGWSSAGSAGSLPFDQTKPWGPGQQAPLTAEYQKILEASLADQANGGQGNFAAHALCAPAGMPFMMVATRPLEFIVSPETTYVLVGGSDHYRRILTDGRDWPKDLDPRLLAETRGFKGPRSYDASGLPLHYDNLARHVLPVKRVTPDFRNAGHRRARPASGRSARGTPAWRARGYGRRATAGPSRSRLR